MNTYIRLDPRKVQNCKVFSLWVSTSLSKTLELQPVLQLDVVDNVGSQQA